MSERIEAHGLIGDLGTAGLISAKGNLSWLCWPDFDSEACFANLVGTSKNGQWSIAPQPLRSSTRSYLPGTLILETRYEQPLGGAATVTDFMPIRSGHSCVVRIVRGVKGRIRMRSCFAPRFDYGSVQARLQQRGDGSWTAVTGPHRLVLRSDIAMRCEGGDLLTEWTIKSGETAAFVLQHSNSYTEPEPPAVDAQAALDETLRYWSNWTSLSKYHGPYREAVERSLLTLKALTNATSGGFLAAPTTSLPEKLGGIRNWDYRFCWLRDTTFSLLGLLHCGYEAEARAWLEWLSRSVQDEPQALKILYGITGKREHSEWKAEWLRGYERSQPVHIGNKASDQLQLDAYGELIDVLYRARCHDIYPLEDRSGEALEVPLLDHLEKVWSKPDAGLWEFRNAPRHFTQSKVMAWVAFDRGIRMTEKFGIAGPVERWKKIRRQIHDEVCSKGFHKGRNSFTQSYGIKELDASLLLLPLVGFLPVQDPRIAGTVRAIEKYLLRDGLLRRYDTAKVKDGLPPGEGAFLACNFWLVDVYVLQGRHEEARAHFEKLLTLRNDLGLLSEEYDRKEGLLGNFPQALSHIALINAALALELGTPIRLYMME
jgi:GH15 family glucan-1,4-alpha-glucosidase